MKSFNLLNNQSVSNFKIEENKSIERNLNIDKINSNLLPINSIRTSFSTKNSISKQLRREIRIKIKPKVEDYLIKRRRDREILKKNIQMYKENLNGEVKPHHEETTGPSISKTININGKELVVRVNSELKDEKKSLFVVNKLTSDKQKN